MINFLKKITASQGLILVGCICAAILLTGCSGKPNNGSTSQQPPSSNNQGDDSESETQENEGEGQDSSDFDDGENQGNEDEDNESENQDSPDTGDGENNEGEGQDSSDTEGAPKTTFADINAVQNLEKAKEAYDLIYNSEDVPGGEQAESIIGDEQAESIIGDEQQVVSSPRRFISIGDDWYVINWKSDVTAYDIANADSNSIMSYINAVTDRDGNVVDLSPGPDGGTNPVVEAILGSNQAAQIDSGTRCIDSAGDPLKCENLL